MRMLSLLTLSVLGFASGATAQDALSARERDYAGRLAGDLGASSEYTVRRLEFQYSAADAIDAATLVSPGSSAPASPAPPMVRGVSVEMDALTVERLRFETPEQAQEVTDRLLNGDLDGMRPITGELRGNQLVLIHGDAVKDPANARRMLERAWKGLPAPKAKPDAAFTQLEDGSVALTTRVDGPLRESIDRALAAAHEREAAARENPESGTITTTPSSARVAFPSGFQAVLQADGQGASLYTVQSKASDEAAMKRHLEALGGHPTQGAAKILERLFGD